MNDLEQTLCRDDSCTPSGIRPRVCTYGGKETDKHRFRSRSTHESSDIKDIRNKVLKRVNIGSFMSTGSVFDSYMLLPNDADYMKDIKSDQCSDLVSGRDSETGEEDKYNIIKLAVENEDILESGTARSLQTEDILAWKILIACTCNMVLLGMNWVVFPVFYDHFINAFTVSHLTAGWIGSLQNSASQILGLVTSAPVQMFGCRPVAMLGAGVASVGLLLSALAPSITCLYISFGVISGTGLSMMNLPCFVIIQQHFHKNRSIATAISMMGFSIGQIIGPMLLDTLIGIFGWRGAIVIFSAVVLNGIPLGMLLLPAKKTTTEGANNIELETNDKNRTPVQVKQKNKKSEILKTLIKQIFDFSLLKHVPFTIFCIGFFLAKFNILGYYQHLTSRMVYVGLSSTLAAALLTITAVCTATNRLVSGFIGNLKCTNRTLMYAVFVTVGGIDTCLLPLATTYYAAAIVCAIYGACLGAIMLMSSVVLVDMLGVENVTRSTGLFNAFSGVAGLLATPFSGYLFDVSHNYDLPFYVIGGMGVTGGLLSFTVLAFNTKPNNQ